MKDPSQTPTDRTVLQGIAIARWAFWGWLAVTAFLQRDELAHPVVATLAIIVALTWTIGCTLLLKTQPRTMSHPVFVVVEVLLAWSFLLIDGWVFTAGHSFGSGQNLAGNWPLISAISAATALGPMWGALLGVFASTGRFFGALTNGVTDFSGKRILSLVSSAVFAAIAAIVFGAMTRRLRAVESEVSMRRARDEIARTLHDGVLQTLALVDRRTRATDPELAAVARSSDRELRAWLFHGVRPEDEGGSLETRLRRVADRVASTYDLDVTVSVLDDPDEPTSNEAVNAALAGAVGEALTNVGKHANVRTAVVFAEVDETGIVFVSVRDDGVGFDTTTEKDGQGLIRSIHARLQEVGGRAEVTSAPGSGTEVRMWSR